MPVENLWDAGAAPSDPVDRLVYASNLLGSDRRITNFGGGNTSLKVRSKDPLTGQEAEVLWVKASGGDLGSAKRSGFASLYLDRLLALEGRHAEGVHEDELVPLYALCAFGGNPAAPSIDTPLHAYVPAAAVSHMHSDAVIAIAACDRSEELTREAFGGDLDYVPWKRPGFELGLMIREVARAGFRGALMGGHGFICWADDWAACYALTLDLINRAEAFIGAHGRPEPFGVRVAAPSVDLADLLPRLRGKTAHEGRRLVAYVDRSDAALDFSMRSEMPRLAGMGTSCPDHFLRTKIRPSVLLTGENLDEVLTRYREDYAAYYARNAGSGDPPMRNPNPSVVILPGVGLVGLGRNATEARITTEFYRNAIEVMRGAEALGRYTPLSEAEAFGIEYWALEEAKLRRQPPEREMARQIAIVVGAGPGIGRSIARRLLERGACVMVADIDEPLARRAGAELGAEYGADVVRACPVDATDRGSVRALIQQAVLAWGGLDALVSVAGLFPAGDVDEALWRRTFDVNVTAAWLLAEEANHVFAAQGLPASIVLCGSANAVVAKKGSLAYDVSKAALNHLVRELAVAFAPLVRVNAVAPATVVAGSQMFPRERVLASLAKYGLPHSPEEGDDALVERLSQFYAQRNLLHVAVSPDAVAEAAVLLASDRLGQTTGHILPVDGGLADAFLR